VVGGVVSLTVTAKVDVAVLPALSDALHVIVVDPSANRPPEPGTQDTGTTPSTSSIAIGFVYITIAPVGPVASAITPACAPITGGVVSTVTVIIAPGVMLLFSLSSDTLRRSSA